MIVYWREEPAARRDGTAPLRLLPRSGYVDVHHRGLHRPHTGWPHCDATIAGLLQMAAGGMHQSFAGWHLCGAKRRNGVHQDIGSTDLTKAGRA